MGSQFTGFSPELFDFLRKLKANNNRIWFEQNKAHYKDLVVEPMLAFIRAMQEPMKQVSPFFLVIPKAQGGSMFRIYRDTRFSKDKRPYKENVGCQFRHEAGKDAHAPGFYLHLEPDNVFFGGGIWLPPSQVLNKIRTVIQAFPKSWQKVLDDASLQQLTGGIQGETLTRPPRGFDAQHPFIEDLKRKSFYAMRQVSEAKACDRKFLSEVVQTYEAISPLMAFLSHSLELRY